VCGGVGHFRRDEDALPNDKKEENMIAATDRPIGEAPRRAARIAYGKSVLETEANAINVLAASLDHHFDDAVSLLLSLRGRVIVTGMGKPGHIARKIAATLASTGIPAFFVHPAEAAHGDLGMLVPGDAVIILSNSGETTELKAIIDHAVAHDFPIVGISSRKESALMRAATIGLLMPHAEEACPANIAPTTSTTMMLALGDALAMAAMQERGVSRDGFERLHPGGSIGRRLMRVAAVMHRGELPLVDSALSMREVVLKITQCSFGVAGVVDEAGVLVGLITDGDLRRHFDDLMTSTAADVMTHHPLTIATHEYAEDALALMNKRKITSMFVTEGDVDPRPVGLVHIHDFVRLGIG
jgi:arabinose-5-phosphate isomerase